MLSRKTEDYLETILVIVEEKGYARPRDIVSKMGVKHPSVTEMLGKLASYELINYEKYGEVKLTTEGLSVARKIKKKHETFEKFLKIIFVSDKVAKEDACTLEHHLNQETIKQFSKFVAFVDALKKRPKFIKLFENYCRTGEMPKKVE